MRHTLQTKNPVSSSQHWHELRMVICVQQLDTLQATPSLCLRLAASDHIVDKKRPCGACRPETTAVAPAAAPAKSLDDHARLSALIIKGRNGTVFDLSPIFQPDVSQYGAMVGANCKNVTLCFDTLVGASTVPVSLHLQLCFVYICCEDAQWVACSWMISPLQYHECACWCGTTVG